MVNQIKHCIHCDCELVLGNNWTEYRKNDYQYICNSCERKRKNAWIKSNPKKKRDQGRRADAKRKGTPKRIASHKRYRQSEKGRLIHRKHNAKQRGLGDTELFPNPFEDSVKVDWHHVSDEFVVAVPRDIHRLYGGHDLQEHKELVMNVINQIYIEGN